MIDYQRAEISSCDFLSLGMVSTRNFPTFSNTTAIAHRQNLEAPGNFRPYAIAVVFANVRKLRVDIGHVIAEYCDSVCIVRGQN